MSVLQLQQQNGSVGWEVSLPSSAILEFRRSLLAWYSQNGRDLPWRHHPDPYAIWVSEIMLQQTQVKTVIPYYQRWLAQFPTIETLAAADLQQVLKTWQGLGYYARARNLHKASQEIIQRHNGIFPTNLSDVLALAGIGRTTAGGILSAAFNQPVAILDGNVKRVLARLVALPVPPTKATKPLWQLSESLLDPQQPRDFNQALMDLGATICTPHNPACNRCPWMFHCRAYNLNIQSTLPMRETSSPIPHKNIGVAVIWNDQKEILIDRRPQNGLLGGLWEFPGGKLEPGETIEECIKREIQEELGIEIEVGKHLITIDHTYTHFRVTLNVHHCRHLTGIPQPIESDEIRWVTLDEIDQFPFPKANVQIIDALRQA
ncbi:A/G-specific adenine glycosylase [Coleofasciculus sp. FACHB-1120]|uniref:A/G-specific adenine glycosylase n=1 Tax=Coleofasciculus sp. FACHB-1120 TaxID=2692783 RepID=UPI0016825810|nr:A/G-specific adenine glycosylase [Coleofasciculus sp. FACHB-1120]MBD2741791.1 A/G-specific adenine glycosylase [Coleofasciculus sp. FACHB-1120]